VIISQPTVLNDGLVVSSATLIGRLVNASGNPYPLGNVTVFDAGGQWIGGAQSAVDGLFIVTTAFGSNVTIAASAQAGLPFTTTLTSVQNGTNNLGSITVSDVAVAETGALSGNQLGAPAASHQPCGASPQDDVGDDPQLQELQTLHDRFNLLLNDSANVAQKPLPPNPPPCDVGNVTEQYDLDLYRRWLNSTGLITTDANRLQPLLSQFQIDINAASQAGFQMQSATASAQAQGTAIFLGVDLQLGVVVILSRVDPQLKEVAAFLGGFLIEWGTIEINQEVTVDDAPELISLMGDFIAIYNRSLGNVISAPFQITGIGLEFSEWGLKLNVAYQAEDAYKQVLQKATADLPAVLAVANQLQNDYNNMDDLQQQPYVGFDPSDCPQPTSPVTNCVTCDRITSTPVASQDPNGKIGPAGYGAANWVEADTTFPYTIDFENSTNATAPAQIVNISDPLSTNFDWTTFQLAEIGFGDQFISIPPNSLFFATNIAMSYEGFSFVVQMQAGINLGTGRVFANFNSIDPVTELAPPVNIGFLPPEDGTGRGAGHVTFFIQPQPNLPTGTQITNVAFIQFDENPIIATDQLNDDDPSEGIDTNKQAIVTIDNSTP